MPPSWHTDYYQSNSVQHYITRAHCYRQFSYQTVISNKLTCHCKIFTLILTLCVSGSSTKQPKLWACFLFAWGIKKHNLYLSDIFLYWISFPLLNRLKSNINSEVSLVKSKGAGFSLSLKSRQLGCKSRWLLVIKSIVGNLRLSLPCLTHFPTKVDSSDLKWPAF